jgi:hypothetical protein
LTQGRRAGPARCGVPGGTAISPCLQVAGERWLAERYGITADVPDVPEGGEAVAIADIIGELVAEPGAEADTPDCGETAVDADIVHDREGERDE